MATNTIFDNNSFDVLLSRHKSRVYAFIMSKVKNRDLAEDIFQDTFIKVINDGNDDLIESLSFGI